LGKVCPWWIGYFLISPLRKLMQHPEKILGPYLKPGMVAVDIGSGMGYFSLPMAVLVGDSGKVICVDLQEKMLSSLKKRARKARLLQRIETRQAEVNTLNLSDIADCADFAIAFNVVHEIPDQERFLREIYDLVKANGTLFLSEPKGHITAQQFAETRSAAQALGFKMISAPYIRREHTCVLVKSPIY
jgi:ubiquinone/menaquinone biosynthesis C-methylase UbiE